MAYTPDTLSVHANLIGGKYRFWTYLTTDDFTDVDATDYFTEAYDMGMREGDTVWVIETDEDPPTVTQAVVSAIDADGNATVTSMVQSSAVFSVMPQIPTATVAATGTVQADAAAITTGFTLVTGADDAKGVKLPAAAAGLWCIIKVADGADLKVWPNTGDAINAIAANSALTVVDDVCFALIAYDATTWYSWPLLPS